MPSSSIAPSQRSTVAREQHRVASGFLQKQSCEPRCMPSVSTTYAYYNVPSLSSPSLSLVSSVLPHPFVERLRSKAIWETGFLVPEPSMDGLEEKWSKWLDKFPVKSIILCSSASEQFLNDDQMKQLANGLVLSGSKA
ncbi:hypothetical protein JHK85_023147 [Glycine max]|nr:hypothetical protein JHK85_023147 [Glycine max]